MNFSELSSEIKSAILKALHICGEPDEIDSQQEEGPAPGTSFLGAVSKMRIGGQCLFFKTESKDEEMRQMFNSENLYKNEVMFYKRVLPRLPKISVVPVVFPEVIFAHPEILVMKDLGEEGFKMCKREFCKPEIAKFVVRALGAFHASSMSLRILEANDYEMFRQCIIETIYTPERAVFQTKLRIVSKMVLQQIQPKFSNRPDLLEKIKLIFQLPVEKINRLLDPGQAEPYNAVCQGDMWLSNMLFRFKQLDDETPESIVFLDFQTSRVASPITDLVYFLYICTNGALRKVHYNDLLDEYYAGFADQVKAVELEIDEVFPKTVFQDHLKRFSIFGLLAAIVMVPIFLGIRPPKDIQEMEKSGRIWQLSETALESIADIITELDQLGYLELNISEK